MQKFRDSNNNSRETYRDMNLLDSQMTDRKNKEKVRQMQMQLL